MMRTIVSGLIVVSALTVAACASQEAAETQDIEQAVRDFIEVNELEEAKEIRTANQDSWDTIDQNFIIYKTRKQDYLIEFARRCRELDEYPVIPDVRTSSNKIHAGLDTIRGCHIAKVYPLNEGEVAELTHIGESPGSRN